MLWNAWRSWTAQSGQGALAAVGAMLLKTSIGTVAFGIRAFWRRGVKVLLLLDIYWLTGIIKSLVKSTYSTIIFDGHFNCHRSNQIHISPLQRLLQ
jgi:hypothetical protein